MSANSYVLHPSSQPAAGVVLPEVSEPEPEVGRGLRVGGLPVGVVSLSGEDENGFCCDGLFSFFLSFSQQRHCCHLSCVECEHLFIVHNQVTEHDMSMLLRTVLVGRRSRGRGSAQHSARKKIMGL